MCPRKDAQAYCIHVLLQRRFDNHLRGLPQTRVNDLHPSIPQCAGDDLSPTVVTVEARLGNQNA